MSDGPSTPQNVWNTRWWGRDGCVHRTAKVFFFLTWWRTRTAVHKVQLAVCHQAAHNVLRLVRLVVKPPREERHLDVGEAAVRVLLQLHDGRVQHVLHPRMLDGVVRSQVILVDGLQPAHVVVGVRDDVHVDHVVRVNLRARGPRVVLLIARPAAAAVDLDREMVQRCALRARPERERKHEGRRPSAATSCAATHHDDPSLSNPPEPEAKIGGSGLVWG